NSTSISYLRTGHSTPRAPPFPYTTLFRSVRPSRLEPCNVGMHGEAKLRIGNRLAALHDATHRVIISDLISDRDGLPAHSIDAARDRKSTRLNSSHSQISYAVFCLKKKTER